MIGFHGTHETLSVNSNIIRGHGHRKGFLYPTEGISTNVYSLMKHLATLLLSSPPPALLDIPSYVPSLTRCAIYYVYTLTEPHQHTSVYTITCHWLVCTGANNKKKSSGQVIVNKVVCWCVCIYSRYTCTKSIMCVLPLPQWWGSLSPPTCGKTISGWKRQWPFWKGQLCTARNKGKYKTNVTHTHTHTDAHIWLIHTLNKNERWIKCQTCSDNLTIMGYAYSKGLLWWQYPY